MKRAFERPALATAVRDYVKDFIIEQNLQPGDPLPPETQLAGDLGVGRSSVREAVKALQSLGIVEVRHGTGLFVRENNFDPVKEILGYGVRANSTGLSQLTELRILLERAAIEDAVPAISREQIDDLKAIMIQWEKRVRLNQPHEDLDESFHRILYGSLGNDMLLEMLHQFWTVFDSYDDPVLHKDKPADEELRQHREILSAVEQRDAPLARQRLLDHFAHLQERVKIVAGIREKGEG